MLGVGKSYQSERGTTIQIVERTPETMSFERTYAPRTGRADPHRHLDFTQTWEAVQGEGEIEVDGETREFKAPDRVAIEPATPHRDPWNPGDGKLVVRGTFDPIIEFIEAYAEAWAHHLSEGTVNDQDEMSLLQILVIAKATDGQSYAAGVPIPVQKLFLPLAARFGKLRGLRASYD
jgi:mannose-6-phosphate isomerase-like protein (cupin superfamily)